MEALKQQKIEELNKEYEDKKNISLMEQKDK
jgi:hypothetical protein